MKEGLQDRSDNNTGGLRVTQEKNIVVRENLIFCDTRDCVGQLSLEQATATFLKRGGRLQASGNITSTSGEGIAPISIVFGNSGSNIKSGDTIIIDSVGGNTNANGTWKVQNYIIQPGGGGTGELFGTIGNGDYTGSGFWLRNADFGVPKLGNNYIIGSTMVCSLNKKLKILRSLTLQNMNIPRDIIPIEVYLPDLIENSLSSKWITFIPQEKNLIKEKLFGFYSTPLEIFRSYTKGFFSPPDSYTPPPLQLWNPLVGDWPSQPVSYPYQTVPTYRTQNFTVSGQQSNFWIICSGYGIYDLLDWTSNTGDIPTDIAITQLARKFLLMAIVQSQSLRDVPSVDLILNCSVTSTGIYPFGYGNFQRFLPGPGLGMAYQPGTQDGADPTVASVDWPIAFPNFRGNVWGPYDSPGDRFQKLGTRTLIQDLFLNGDLNNLLGTSLIYDDINVTDIINHNTFGININSINIVSTGTLEGATNLNITNSQRIIPNGYGALTVQSRGSGNPNFVSKFLDSGGQGPSSEGTPQAWVSTSVTGVTASFTDPLACGPIAHSPGLLDDPQIRTSKILDSTFVGDGGGGKIITNRSGWYDQKVQKGTFLKGFSKYLKWMTSRLPDTNLVLTIFQAQRDQRVQSTNSNINNSIVSIPIRLNVSTSTGNRQYIENMTLYVSGNQKMWQKRFLNPKQELDKLEIEFQTYEGHKIDLEKMLLPKPSIFIIQNLRKFLQGFPESNIDLDVILSYDPLNPLLNGKTVRNLSLSFLVETYEYENPGNSVRELLEATSDLEYDQIRSENNFVVRASNYS